MFEKLKGKMESTDIDMLSDVFIKQLEDIYDAENQLIDAIQEMHDAASDSKAKDAFKTHKEEETKEG